MDVQFGRLVAEGSFQVSCSPPRASRGAALGPASILASRRARFGAQAWLASAAVVVASALSACGGQSVPSPSAPAQEHATTSVESVAAPSGSAQPGAPSPEPAQAAAPRSDFTMPDVTFVPARTSDMPSKLPRPWIETPGFDQFVARAWIANYKVIIKVPNWDRVPADSYVQFVFDGRPLDPVTDFKNGVKLQELAGQDALADGEHILAAYVARPNHESIKGPSGISVHRFWIGKKSPDTFKGNEPILVLGTPHGEYKGDAAYDILIDWYVVNAVLDKKEFNVHLVLKGPGLPEEGAERYATEWRPWTIVSAKPGEYTLRADLIDKQGHVAKGTWTSVTRTFRVN